MNAPLPGAILSITGACFLHVVAFIYTILLGTFVEPLKRRQSRQVICDDKVERLVGAARVVPWKIFLDRLRAGDYLK
jgi:hypothetical protein